MPTVHLFIKGKVQGVFYRANAKKTAEENHITGWVQNTPDGEVELVASAPQEALNTLIEWCKKGTTRAHVAEVQITEIKDETFNHFTIRR